MTIDEIRGLIAAGETRTLELKKTTGELKDGMHTACAFLNNDNRVEIENPGRLPNALTVETMKQPHDSYPMNTLIADVLFLTTFLDSWGSGVHRMVEVCKSHGVDEPEYELRPGGLVVVFKRRSDEHKNEHKNEHKKLSSRQRRIIEYIKKDPSVSIVKLAETIGVSESTLRRDLKVVAYHEGPNNGGRWFLKNSH